MVLEHSRCVAGFNNVLIIATCSMHSFGTRSDLCSRFHEHINNVCVTGLYVTCSVVYSRFVTPDLNHCNHWFTARVPDCRVFITDALARAATRPTHAPANRARNDLRVVDCTVQVLKFKEISN